MAVSAEFQGEGSGAQPGPRLPGSRPADGRQASDEGNGAQRGTRPARTGWYVAGLLGFAAANAMLAIFAYNGLSNWRWSTHLSASASAPASSVLFEQLHVAGARGRPVRWQIDDAYIRQLTVAGTAQGTAGILLPIPRRRCPEMAQMLGASSSCTASGQLTLSSPVTFAWSDLEEVASPVVHIGSASLDVTENLVTPGQPAVDIAPAGARHPSLCFVLPHPPVTLTISHGAGSYPYQFVSSEANLSCDQGVSIVVGSDRSAPIFEFTGVQGLTMSAVGQSAAIQGFSGQLNLDPGSQTFTHGPEHVSVAAPPDAGPVQTRLQTGQDVQKLTLLSTGVTSVLTDAGQAVPSAWARLTAVFAPLLGGYVTATVFGPVTAFIQLFTDGLKKWRGPAWLGRLAARIRRRGKPGEGGSDAPKDRSDAA
jgi:hypothetical protein